MAADPVQAAAFAAELRTLIGELVRRVRSESDTLTPRLAAVLGHLQRDGAMSTSALALRQHVRHQSMVATLKELEALHYIERRPDPGDRRATLIAISPEGSERLEAERLRRSSWLAQAIAARLSERELAQLVDCLPLLQRLIAVDDEAPD